MRDTTDWDAVTRNMAHTFGELAIERATQGDADGAMAWERRRKVAERGMIPMHPEDARDPLYMRDYGRQAGGEAQAARRVDYGDGLASTSKIPPGSLFADGSPASDEDVWL